MKNLINTIKYEFPDKAIDISESLELLNEVISSIIEDISVELNQAIITRDKLKMVKYNDLTIQVFNHENKIEEVINLSLHVQAWIKGVRPLWSLFNYLYLTK